MTSTLPILRSSIASLRALLEEAGADPEVMRPRGHFVTCRRHGWDAWNEACPRCRGGDAPRVCVLHGWNHLTKGCPECAGEVN